MQYNIALSWNSNFLHIRKLQAHSLLEINPRRPPIEKLQFFVCSPSTLFVFLNKRIERKKQNLADYNFYAYASVFDDVTFQKRNI